MTCFSSPRRAAALALLTACALTSACGSTVQVRGTALSGQTGQNGLPADGLAPGSAVTDPAAAAPEAESADGGSVGQAAPGLTEALTPGGAPSSPGRSFPGPSGSGGAGTGLASAQARPAAGAPAPGKGITTPLLIGVLAAGDTQEGASQGGAKSGTSTSASKALKALVKHYTKSGIGGRPVKVVFREIPVTTTNYDVELQSACAQFTQDNKVELVLSNIGYYNPVFEACLKKKGVPHIEGAWGVTDDSDFRTFPDYYTPSMPSYDARYRATIAAGVAAGKLTRGMKVGVVVEDCPFIRRAFDNAFKPAAQAAGLVLDELHKKCTEGFQDAGAIATAGQNAASRFAINRDQTVMFASYPTGVDLTFFSQAAESQQYRPAYYLDSLAQAQTLADTNNMPRAQFEKVAGFGWMLATDTVKPSFDRPAQKRCLDLLKPTLSIQSGADYELAFSSCDAFTLLEDAMRRSGGSVQKDQLRAAVEGLGQTHDVAANVGTSTFGPGKHYGQSEARTFAYAASCRCLGYTGPARAYR